MTIEGPRVLNKILPVFYGTNASLAPFLPVTNDTFEDLGTGTYVYRTYYDLSGYNRKDLTAFFQGVDIQEGTFNSTNMYQMNIVDLITTEFMSDAACIQAAAFGFADGDAPGFPLSVYDLDQVVYGRRRTWARTDAGQINQVTPLFNVATYGTCSGASSDKLHITRIISVPAGPAADEYFRVSPSAYITAIIVAEEKELAYLMRQKRSYEIATGP